MTLCIRHRENVQIVKEQENSIKVGQLVLEVAHKVNPLVQTYEVAVDITSSTKMTVTVECPECKKLKDKLVDFNFDPELCDECFDYNPGSKWN